MFVGAVLIGAVGAGILGSRAGLGRAPLVALELGVAAVGAALAVRFAALTRALRRATRPDGTEARAPQARPAEGRAGSHEPADPALSVDAPLAAWLDDALAARPQYAPPAVVSFRSAVELGRDRGRYDESLALTDDARALADTRAAQVQIGPLVRAEVLPVLKRRSLSLGGLALTVAALGVAMPSHLERALSVFSAVSRLENPLSTLPPEPRFDDLVITYRYPAYTLRPPAVADAPGGEIRALPGTEVTIETSAMERLAEATLLVSFGQDDETTRTAAEVDGRHVRARFVVSRGGRYRFAIKTADGDLMEERRGRPIELELDAAPEVTLLQPETSPLEVNEQDRVPMEVEARDDFALGDARVAWRVIGTTREGKVPLALAGRGGKRLRDKFTLDLGPLELRPGDRVAYSVEVLDNDTVTGPKVGASETKELRIYSKQNHHREVLAKAEAALDELVHVLGDNVERAFTELPESEAYAALLADTTKMVERARGAGELVREVVQAIQKDPLGQKAIAQAFEQTRVELTKDVRAKATALDAARAAFDKQKRADARRTSDVTRRQGELVAGLEKNVVYLADLLNDQRMADAADLTKRLREEQANLRKALEEYRTAPSEERRKLMMQAISEIKQRIQDITAQLAELKGSIPADFVSPDALEQKDQLADMDRVQKMIEEGNLDEAMAELDKMLTETEKMLGQMNEGRDEIGSREYSEIMERAEQLWKDLEKVEEEQAAIGRRAEQASRQVLDKMKERLGNADKFVEKQLERLQGAQAAIEKAKPPTRFGEGDVFDQALRRVEDTKKALQARDFGAAREAVQQALQNARQLADDANRRAEQAERFGDFFGDPRELQRARENLRSATPELEGVMRELDKLLPSPEQLMGPKDREALEQLGQRQESVRQRTAELKRDLEQLAEQLPMVGEGTTETLDEAGSAMQRAKDGFGKADAPKGLSGHQDAMEALQRLKKSLENMAQNKGGSGGQGRGVPLPFGPPQGAGGSGDQRGEREGFDPRTMDKVEIPQPEQYKAPAEFREDILKAAKQSTAESYKEAVKRYYEEIVK